MTPEEISELILRLPELLKHPDTDGTTPDFVGLGVDDRGDWQICRWIGGDPFDEDGPIGQSPDLSVALTEAFNVFATRCYFCEKPLDISRKIRLFHVEGELQHCCVSGHSRLLKRVTDI